MDDTDKKLIRARISWDTEVILHGILFTVSMFLEKKPVGKKRIKIQPALLLERHALPFPPVLSPCLLPPVRRMHTKLPRALYFHAAK
ncbi:hypothetical protein P9875_19330 [Janthinobacterium rivuli]|uniref:Uncharacterized protein n=1 Tax=Janthinobacterium rivuli TaxID=2751478 RepID=A0ABY8HZ08_9BURK|nr:MULTISPECIES: hypothetical protein [Janthinobacterium]NVI84782.1 hypothetical protein [Janthinobacterium sp. BJB401]WFR77869.1 hypothetical protein P9875_19330 [Janthinobacterium rivuli]